MYGIAAVFAVPAVIFAKCAAICRIFTAKGATILELRHFTRWRTAARPSKCGAFGERKAAAYMVPCFQVPLRRVCYILFDIYRTCTVVSTVCQWCYYPLFDLLCTFLFLIFFTLKEFLRVLYFNAHPTSVFQITHI